MTRFTKAITSASFFEKIADTIAGATTTGSMDSSGGSSINSISVKIPAGGTNGTTNVFKASRNLQGTISKARTNADVQSLYKDHPDINAQTDVDKQIGDRQSNSLMSHMNDPRVAVRPGI